MIVSFYDKDFKALQNNAGLVVDKESFKLIKRPTEMNEFSCICEAFTENIQPMFLVVKDDKGSNSLVYASLAGIPQLNGRNQTEVNATDLKSMLSCDVILEKIKVSEFSTVNDYISYVFDEWNKQVVQGSYDCELIFNDNVDAIEMDSLVPEIECVCEVFNAWEELQPFLRCYQLFMDTAIDIVNKKIQFIIGRTMYRNMNIKLWEYGIKNYGKWIANVNECQGFYLPENATSINQLQPGTRWILTSQNKITTDESKRDIYPIKRSVVISNDSLEKASRNTLESLLDALYNENIELPAQTINPDFETNFAVYVKQGEEKYKDLPCGELQYDSNGLTNVQIGYRYDGVEQLFI